VLALRSAGADRLRGDQLLSTKRVARTQVRLIDVLEPIIAECDALAEKEVDREEAFRACVAEVLDHIASGALSLRDAYASTPKERVGEAKAAALSSPAFRKSLNGKPLAALARPLFDACEASVQAREDAQSASYLFVCVSELASLLRNVANDLLSDLVA
jgi:hypothetical protein